MNKKVIVGLAAAGVLIAGIGCYIGFGGKGGSILDENAFRAQADILADDAVFLDDAAIALADESESNTELRAEALEAYNLVNEEREAAGLDDLSWNQNLESTSAVRSREASESFSHTRPNGSAWYTVNSSIQGGENLAFGFDTADQAMEGWMNSPTHRDNILYSDFNEIAISIYQTDDGTLYWAQEFGY